MIDIDLVFSGSGTLVPCHLGALARIQYAHTPRRALGTSGGGIVAAGLGTGKSVPSMMELCQKFLKKELLDPSLWPFDGYGIHDGERIKKLLREIFPGTMGQGAVIPWAVVAVDMTTRRPQVFSSWGTPDILKYEAIYNSMAIEGFFKMGRASHPAFRGHQFADGGIAMNFAMDLFDDVPDRPTFGVRFKADTCHPKPIRSLKDYFLALAEVTLWSANNAFISHKKVSKIIEIDSKGDPLDFDLNIAQIHDRYEEGFEAAQSFFIKNKDDTIGFGTDPRFKVKG